MLSSIWIYKQHIWVNSAYQQRWPHLHNIQTRIRSVRLMSLRIRQVAYWCRGFEGDLKVCYLNADLADRAIRVVHLLPRLSSQHDVVIMNIVSFPLPILTSAPICFFLCPCSCGQSPARNCSIIWCLKQVNTHLSRHVIHWDRVRKPFNPADII